MALYSTLNQSAQGTYQTGMLTFGSTAQNIQDHGEAHLSIHNTGLDHFL